MASTADTLLSGIGDILTTWRARGGERDPFHWIVKLQLARATGDEASVIAALPPAFADELRRRHSEISAYWDNVRYALLDPLAAVWGTVVNALRVAADVPSVTADQKRVFATSIESLDSFFRAAHEHGSVSEDLHEAFRPMPAPDCQALAALFHPEARPGGRNLIALIKMLSAEGPLTAAESEALAVLASSGLSHFAFRGARRNG
jgi:hypothetical protein